MVIGTLRDDLPFAVVATIGNFIAFNFALRNVIDTGNITYPQYILPVVLVQVTFLGVLTAVDRAARDRQSDFGIQLRTLPIPAAVPLMARMLYCIIRGVVVLLTTFAIGYVFGFRMIGGPLCALAFCAITLLLTLAVSLGADAAGSRLGDSPIGKGGTASQVLLVPQMLLVILSTGMAPVESFPDWLHTFVEYQPVSQVTETLRGLASGHVMVGNLATTLAWCFGMLGLFGVAALRMQRRTT
jgi:ABC-2 type transport system permease protein